MIEQLDHVGIVVDDLEATIELYEQKFNMTDPYREVLEEQHVEVVLFDVGPNHVELLRPLHPDTSCGRFLEKRGPGVHHISYGIESSPAVALRVSEEELTKLQKALGSDGCHDVEGEDGTLRVKLKMI